MPDGYDVVIPTHGRNVDLLLAAIASVKRQTVSPDRVLVIVDGNHEVAAWLTAAAPDVEVLVHDRPRGAAAARQTGIDAATATWVAFLDDDDLWTTRKQQVLLDYVRRRPDCEAVRAGYWVTGPAEGELAPLFGQQLELRGDSFAELEEAARLARPLNSLEYLEIQGRSLPLMLEFNRGVMSTSMVRRTVLEGIPPVPSGLTPGDDYLLFCHVAARTEWHLVRERLLFYRLHPGQHSRTGGAAAGLGILTAKRIAWNLYGAQCPRPLSSYGAIYASEVRRMMWSAVRAGEPRGAIEIYRLGSRLLPRWRHRAAAAVPEPVAWRAGRLRNPHRRTPVRPPTW